MVPVFRRGISLAPLAVIRQRRFYAYWRYHGSMELTLPQKRYLIEAFKLSGGVGNHYSPKKVEAALNMTGTAGDDARRALEAEHLLENDTASAAVIDAINADDEVAYTVARRDEIRWKLMGQDEPQQVGIVASVTASGRELARHLLEERKAIYRGRVWKAFVYVWGIGMTIAIARLNARLNQQAPPPTPLATSQP